MGFEEDTKLYKIELVDKKDRAQDPKSTDEELKLTAMEEMIVKI